MMKSMNNKLNKIIPILFIGIIALLILMPIINIGSTFFDYSLHEFLNDMLYAIMFIIPTSIIISIGLE